MNMTKRSSVEWLYTVPGNKKIQILALTIVQMLNGASGVLYALFLRGIVDSAVDKNIWGFRLNTVYIILLVLVQISLSAISRWLTELSRSSFENLFKERLMHNILRKDHGRVNAMHSGEWMNRLTSDTMLVANSYSEVIPGFAGMAVKMLSALVMITVLDPRFAFIMIPLGFILGILTFVFRRNMKKLHKKVQEKDGALRIFLQERINSLTIIRVFAAVEQTDKETHEKTGDHKRARMKKNAFSNLCNIGFGGAMNGMYLLGVVYCGYGILTGTITYGTLTAITQLITQIQSPFANITGYLPKWYAMLASAERLMEIENFDDDLTEQVYDSVYIRDYYRNELTSVGMRDVSYTYYPASNKVECLLKNDMPVAIEGLNIEINKGEYVAFTGSSGCGKSTALMLLMGVYKMDNGKRYIRKTDNTTEELSAKWQKLFAYVPQGNKLMSGTVRDVVTFADRMQYDNDEKIIDALKIACAYDFISELDDGINTVLGERGTGLSEGQMQRLAIARAVFSDAPILMLDEATSALDEATEKELLRNLRSLTDKTVVLVTHRPEALKICDRVIEFK